MVSPLFRALFRALFRGPSIRGLSPIPRSVVAAARAWRGYRTRGGKRERVAADFLIGAHAMEQCERLLSRDRGFYRECFKGLKLLDPSAGLVSA